MSNALVPLAHAEETAAPLRPVVRVNADFVAHLIATSAQLPQTRARRRVEPQVATAAYDALGHWPTPAGRALSRTL